jgi:hypothetical protein
LENEGTAKVAQGSAKGGRELLRYHPATLKGGGKVVTHRHLATRRSAAFGRKAG